MVHDGAAQEEVLATSKKNGLYTSTKKDEVKENFSHFLLQYNVQGENFENFEMKPVSFYVAEEMRGRKLSDSEFAELQQIFQDEFHQVPQAVGMFLFSANRCRIANYLYPQCRPAKCQLWVPYAVGTKCPEVVLGAHREFSVNLDQQRTFP